MSGRYGSFLAPRPVELLRGDPELASLPEAFERLGVGTLGRACGAAAGGRGRPLRAARPARPAARPRWRHAPASARGRRVGARVAGTAGGLQRSAARARARPADRPAARPARAARAHTARRRAVGEAGRARRHLAPAGHVPRVAQRPGADAVGADAAPAAAAGPGARNCALRSSASGRRPATSRRCWRSRRGRGRLACARRSARCAPPPDPTPLCASCRSIRARASPSAARCWRRSRGELDVASRLTQRCGNDYTEDV